MSSSGMGEKKALQGEGKEGLRMEGGCTLGLRGERILGDILVGEGAVVIGVSSSSMERSSIRFTSDGSLDASCALSRSEELAMSIFSCFGIKLSWLGSAAGSLEEASSIPSCRSSRLIVSPVLTILCLHPSINDTASCHRASIFSHPCLRRMISSSLTSTSSRGTKAGFVSRPRRCSRTSSMVIASSSYEGGAAIARSQVPVVSPLSGPTGSPCKFLRVSRVFLTRLIKASFSSLSPWLSWVKNSVVSCVSEYSGLFRSTSFWTCLVVD